MASGKTLKAVEKLKPEYMVFIQEFVANGNDHIAACMKAFPQASRKSAATIGKRLLNHKAIKPVIEEAMLRKATLVNEARDSEIIAAAKSRVLSEVEVDALLCDIIKGDHKVKQTFVIRGQLVKVDVEPDHSAKLSAIDKYYKRFGSYAPEKHTFPPDPLQQKSTEELKALLEKTQQLLND